MKVMQYYLQKGSGIRVVVKIQMDGEYQIGETPPRREFVVSTNGEEASCPAMPA